MKNIYLVGFMGTGKTTVGRILSKRLSKNFIEMDTLIEKNEGKKISDIFAVCGESYFRKLEKETLNKISALTDLVVSGGGGLICNDENLKILLGTGIVFCLNASAETIYKRTKKYTHRPLLNVDNPLEKIEALLNARRHYYNQAHYKVDTDNLSTDAVADKIIESLEHK